MTSINNINHFTSVKKKPNIRQNSICVSTSRFECCNVSFDATSPNVYTKTHFLTVAHQGNNRNFRSGIPFCCFFLLSVISILVFSVANYVYFHHDENTLLCGNSFKCFQYFNVHDLRSLFSSFFNIFLVQFGCSLGISEFRKTLLLNNVSLSVGGSNEYTFLHTNWFRRECHTVFSQILENKLKRLNPTAVRIIWQVEINSA